MSYSSGSAKNSQHHARLETDFGKTVILYGVINHF